MAIIEVENLVKTYGRGENKVNAVDDISFSVQKGEFVAIVGASGSGKSTLLHLLGGVDRPTSGKVLAVSGDTVEDFFVRKPRRACAIENEYNVKNRKKACQLIINLN